MLTDIQKQVLKKIVNTLNQHNISFQVSGGLAAIIYGAKRPLFDIDISVKKADMEKVKSLFKQYLTKDYHHFVNKVFDLYIMEFEVEGVHVDVSQGEEFYVFDKAGNKIRMDDVVPAMVKFMGVDLPVEKREELIRYKKMIGRETDLEDIRQIS